MIVYHSLQLGAWLNNGGRWNEVEPKGLAWIYTHGGALLREQMADDLLTLSSSIKPIKNLHCCIKPVE